MRVDRRSALSAALVLAVPELRVSSARADTAAPSRDEMVSMLKDLDEKQSSRGDWSSVAYVEQKERGKVDIVYEALVYRRTQDQRFVFLVTKPKAAQGQGYLRVDKNLWYYDAKVGKWERRTEREKIAGTNSRRADYDESRLAEEYDPEFVRYDTLGSHATVVLKLKGKPDKDLAFPELKLWLEKATRNELKRQEFALSGRLLRTSYRTKWAKKFSESKRAEVWFPQEIRLYDELETANATVIQLKNLDFKKLDPNIFTKAWLESKVR
jgi:hypothetical protein